MIRDERAWAPFRLYWLVMLAGLLPIAASALLGEQPASSNKSPQAGSNVASVCEPSKIGSPFIPVDSWVYPSMLRLYSLGYLDDVFLGLRPWTRASVEGMLEQASPRIDDAEEDGDPSADQARSIYDAVSRFILGDVQGPCRNHQGNTKVESVYSVARGISGTPLSDSFHLGSTVINDYGRPFENGFSSYTGASGYAGLGRFEIYLRGEFQGAPSAAGYSTAMGQVLSLVDETSFYLPGTTTPYSQTTIPMGPIGTATNGRLLEAYVSGQVLNHVISFGKQDEWMGPGEGGAFAYSNNAQNIYALHINRVEPLHIPLLSRLTGPFRYEFLIGELRGHTLMTNPAYTPGSTTQPNVINPGNPWVQVEKISFRPTQNLEFGFERTVIFGGEGHSPVTLHTFLKSFFSTTGVGSAEKNGRDDPGARFGAFDFSYRLPFLRKWLMLYADGEVHDDISPIDAPRRASWRPGIYLSHFPGISRLDLRVESASTDPASSSGRKYGRFMYWEHVERQGYTNQGQLFGDWIGREDKGGQAWLTWHLSGNEWIQLNARAQKAVKDFIPGSSVLTTTGTGCSVGAPCTTPGGTTLADVGVQVVKRIGANFEINAGFTDEHWTAPIYLPGRQSVTNTNIQLTWYPQRKISF
jgi:hypothetical protein